MNSSETLRGIVQKLKQMQFLKVQNLKPFVSIMRQKAVRKTRRDNVRLLHKLMRLTKVIDVALN